MKVLNEEANLADEQMLQLVALGMQTASVVHDLNNPLMLVMQYTNFAKEILQEVPQSSFPQQQELQNALEKIGKHAQRASTVVQQVLQDISHSRIGTVNEPTDLDSIIESMREELSQRATIRHVPIRFALNAKGAKAIVDIGRLQQAVLNIADNAFDAVATYNERAVRFDPHAPGNKLCSEYDACIDSPELPFDFHGVTLHSRIVEFSKGRRAQGRSHRLWRLYVEDTGTGIDPLVLEKLFIPFVTTRQFDEGTGLGLVVSHDLITGMEGTLYGCNRLSGGACFMISIPIAEND